MMTLEAMIVIEQKILLSGIHKVREFNQIASAQAYDVDLRSGKYYINAKSIIGIFSLDLSGPVTLVADTEDEALVREVFAAYLVEC